MLRVAVATNITSKIWEDLRKSVAPISRKLSDSITSDKSLETLLASRLIPFDECPDARPIGASEVIRRIIGKAVMYLAKKHVMDPSSDIQICVGQRWGSDVSTNTIRSF